MGVLLERRKGIEEYNRNARYMRLLRLFEGGLAAAEIAKREGLSRARVYVLLNEALAARERGNI